MSCKIGFGRLKRNWFMNLDLQRGAALDYSNLKVVMKTTRIGVKIAGLRQIL